MNNRQVNTEVTTLVMEALKQSKITGLSEVLKSIATIMDAYGCIFWQVAPVSNLDANPPQGRLFVQAQWFQDESIQPLHELPFNSVTAKAALKQEIVNIKDAVNDQSITLHSFLERAKIKTFCSLPLKSDGKPLGALNIYRNFDTPFSQEELNYAEQLAGLVPALYQTIRDEVSFNLVLEVNRILHEAEYGVREQLASWKEVKRVIQRICTLVTDTFQCMETSIFLEDRLEMPGSYTLMATTWPWPSEFKRRIYERGEDASLTGWVLSNRKPVKIFDLAQFERDREAIISDYPGLAWKDSLAIKSAAVRFFKTPSYQNLPALSFIAAPLIIGTSTLGVIRCCTARKGPYYFANHELNLLGLVATQISQYWHNWLNRREIQEENVSWRTLVESIGKLNSFVQDELSREDVYRSEIFSEALRVTRTVINGANILDIRLFDEEKSELYFANVLGSEWERGNEKEVRERRHRRFPSKHKSAGIHVIETGQVYEMSDVKRDIFYSETFPDTKRMIIAPIKLEGGTQNAPIGVLDVRGTGERPFPVHAKAIAELIGKQLGLYHFLAETINKLHSARHELKDNVRRQNQTFEDLEHQLKSPIFQAHARIQAALSGGLTDERRQLYLSAVRGLCGKAKRVTMNTGLYGKLASHKPIEPKPSKLYYDRLGKMLFEAATDHRLLIDPARLIDFNLDRESFKTLEYNEVLVDFDLLEQAVNNLLDNAYKYSFSNSIVRIRGGLTGKKQFFLSIENKGISINRNDIRHLSTRGWRSEAAQSVTGEGSGIGLWIVSHIMKEHNGELLIAPTTVDNLTEVRLIFPVTGR